MHTFDKIPSRILGSMGSIISRLANTYYYYRAWHFFEAVGGTGCITLHKNVETGFAELIIENVKKRNAISGKMILEFAEVVSTLEKWKEGKALLIRGEGGNFCSGGDLDMVKLLDTKEKTRYLSVIMTDNLKRLSSLPLVTAVYVNGSGAIGGGSEIAMSADVRIIGSGSKIGLIHRKMGIVPAWGGTTRLKGILGSDKTLKILLEGRVYDAEECLQLGLVDYIEEDLERARNRLLSMVHDLHYEVAQSVKKSVMSESIEEQGDLCAKLIGGEQNTKALKNRIKHIKQ